MNRTPKNKGASAFELVDLIKMVVRDEMAKATTVEVYSVYGYDSKTGLYDLYLDTGKELSKVSSNVIHGVPNATVREFQVGDRVYVMKVNNQIAQSFIIAGMGSVKV